MILEFCNSEDGSGVDTCDMALAACIALSQTLITGSTDHQQPPGTQGGLFVKFVLAQRSLIIDLIRSRISLMMTVT